MKQTVTLLIGLPGSGKTTFYEQHFSSEADVRISQDMLGSKEACVLELEAVLERGQSAVIDRVNFNKKQRQTWIDIARKHGAEVHAIYLEVPKDICLDRLNNRKGHETIPEEMPEERKLEIIEQFDKMMFIPDLSEGYKTVIMMRNN